MLGHLKPWLLEKVERMPPHRRRLSSVKLQDVVMMPVDFLPPFEPKGHLCVLINMISCPISILG
jgi:hypothetical protein